MRTRGARPNPSRAQYIEERRFGPSEEKFRKTSVTAIDWRGYDDLASHFETDLHGDALSMTSFRLALVALLLCCATESQALAQGGGAVSGTVSDETGGVLPGVSVTLQPAGAALLETVTDDAGRYRFDNVPAGAGEISFRLINFSAVRRRITVSPTSATANAVMLVAASADITITAPRTFRNLAEIENPAENLVGVASAGSEGAITAAQLAVRPVNRATEVLETVPGLVISQHSGEGKANQYTCAGSTSITASTSPRPSPASR